MAQKLFKLDKFTTIRIGKTCSFYLPCHLGCPLLLLELVVRHKRSVGNLAMTRESLAADLYTFV